MRLEAETALDIHDDGAGARRDGESIDGVFGCRMTDFASDLRKQSERYNDETAQYHRR